MKKTQVYFVKSMLCRECESMGTILSKTLTFNICSSCWLVIQALCYLCWCWRI